MHIVNVVIPVIWIVFWIYWFAASLNVKVTQTRSSSLVGVRVVLILLVLVLLRAGLLRGHSATVRDPWLQALGLAIFLLGLACAVWARVYLGRNWGAPMSEKANPELVTTGPYRYVRHPIYSAIILGMIGTTIAISPYWLAAAVLLAAYFIYSATVEERNMEHLFPEAYPAYKRSTKMLIPFVF